MTTSAWVFLGVAWAVIIVATVYCFAKLLGSEQQFGDHSQEPE
jgi:hypothetical protein